jgi:hypothetical protein
MQLHLFILIYVTVEKTFFAIIFALLLFDHYKVQTIYPGTVK